MSTLTALARAQAWDAGRAVPTATVRHLHVSDRPLVVVPLVMAGEANAPLAAMIGTHRSMPRLLVVGQPRNPDERLVFASDLAGVLLPYLDAFTHETEQVPVDRGRDVRLRFTDAPQIWVPNPGGIDFLRLFGRNTRFRGDLLDKPDIPLLGRWLTFFAQSAEMAGACLIMNAVGALSMHWATGQSAAEDAHLPALMAWIDPRDGVPGSVAARFAEDMPSAGPATDPDFDNRVLAPLIEAGDPDGLEKALRDAINPTWDLMWTALDLLRRMPPGARVAARRDTDRDVFSAYVAHLAEDGPPQPRRDGAVAAASRLQRLENAAARYAVQRAFDDPLVMAEHRLTGNAFRGLVTLANPDRIDDSGKRPILRPRIMVRTTETVRVEAGASLTSPDRPAQKCRVVSLTALPGGATDVLLELSGGMGRKLVAEPGSVPAIGEQLLLTTLSEAYRPGGAFPEPADTPWTHGGPPVTTASDEETSPE